MQSKYKTHIRYKHMTAQSKIAMRILKVRLCIEDKMTVSEMRSHTGMSLENIQKTLDENPDLAAAHTFAQLARTRIDERRIDQKLGINRLNSGGFGIKK